MSKPAAGFAAERLHQGEIFSDPRQAGPSVHVAAHESRSPGLGFPDQVGYFLLRTCRASAHCAAAGRQRHGECGLQRQAPPAVRFEHFPRLSIRVGPATPAVTLKSHFNHDEFSDMISASTLYQSDLSRMDLNLLVLFEIVLDERRVGRSAERLNLGVRGQPWAWPLAGAARRSLFQDAARRRSNGARPPARNVSG